MRRQVGLLFVGIILVSQVAVSAAEISVAVSPGSAAGSLIGDSCPTFSWGAVPGAKSYELVVYRVEDDNEEAKPALRQRISGTALGWTPSLDRCLERGAQYAWSVRAVGRKEPSEWSAPSLFEVAAGPSEEEFEAALKVVSQYLEEEGISAHKPSSEQVAVVADARVSLRDVQSVRVDRHTLSGPAAQGIRIEGEPVLSGYEREVGLSGVCGPGQICTGLVICPTGKVALGGGANQIGTILTMMESHPPSDDRWEVKVKNTTGSDGVWEPWVTCAASL